MNERTNYANRVIMTPEKYTQNKSEETQNWRKRKGKKEKRKKKKRK